MKIETSQLDMPDFFFWQDPCAVPCVMKKAPSPNVKESYTSNPHQMFLVSIPGSDRLQLTDRPTDQPTTQPTKSAADKSKNLVLPLQWRQLKPYKSHQSLTKIYIWLLWINLSLVSDKVLTNLTLLDQTVYIKKFVFHWKTSLYIYLMVDHWIVVHWYG